MNFWDSQTLIHFSCDDIDPEGVLEKVLGDIYVRWRI